MEAVMMGIMSSEMGRTVQDASIDCIVRQMDWTLRTGDHSSPRIDAQM